MHYNNSVKHRYFFTFLLCYFFFLCTIHAQQDRVLPDKVHHAEPLYNDLVRDLGARKGEKEINLGIDIKRTRSIDEYGYLAEYEFAPLDHLGLEIEADFMYTKSKEPNIASINKLERLRLSSQYSFYISKVKSTTFAIGYTQIVDFNNKSIASNPFFIGAKSWDKYWHTLIYTGPEIDFSPHLQQTEVSWQINTSFLYALPHTDHFFGIEVDQNLSNGNLNTTLRPQIKLGLSDKIAIGTAIGIPIHQLENTLSGFLRLIYQL